MNHFTAKLPKRAGSGFSDSRSAAVKWDALIDESLGFEDDTLGTRLDIQSIHCEKN